MGPAEGGTAAAAAAATTLAAAAAAAVAAAAAAAAGEGVREGPIAGEKVTRRPPVLAAPLPVRCCFWAASLASRALTCPGASTTASRAMQREGGAPG